MGKQKICFQNRLNNHQQMNGIKKKSKKVKIKNEIMNN